MSGIYNYVTSIPGGVYGYFYPPEVQMEETLPEVYQTFELPLDEMSTSLNSVAKELGDSATPEDIWKYLVQKRFGKYIQPPTDYTWEQTYEYCIHEMDPIFHDIEKLISKLPKEHVHMLSEMRFRQTLLYLRLNRPSKTMDVIRNILDPLLKAKALQYQITYYRSAVIEDLENEASSALKEILARARSDRIISKKQMQEMLNFTLSLEDIENEILPSMRLDASGGGDFDIQDKVTEARHHFESDQIEWAKETLNAIPYPLHFFYAVLELEKEYPIIFDEFNIESRFTDMEDDSVQILSRFTQALILSRPSRVERRLIFKLETLGNATAARKKLLLQELEIQAKFFPN